MLKLARGGARAAVWGGWGGRGRDDGAGRREAVARAGRRVAQAQLHCATRKVIDLRSDTVTRPCEVMRRRMAEAKVGDDVYGEDPTITHLENVVAKLLGKEDAVFMASGTMANLTAVLAQAGRGEEVIVGDASHLYKWEQRNVSALGGCALTAYPNAADGSILLPDLHALCSAVDSHVPVPRLVCLENTHGGCFGTAIGRREMEEMGHKVKAAGLLLHVDGARLLNAAVGLGQEPAELAAPADTVSLCLSKGLGAPLGSVLAGGHRTVTQARRWRKALGGGMRQAGVIAAAGLYGIEEYKVRLGMDHRRARELREELKAVSKRLGGFEERAGPHPTNMVFLDLSGSSLMADKLCEHLRRGGVLASSYEGSQCVRMVLHRDVDDEDLERVVGQVQESIQLLLSSRPR
eukprot:762768-Hanusia_phi.AAC.3